MKEEITRIEGSDGPTAVFIAGRNNGTITIRQRIQRFINRTRRKHIENYIKAEPHTINQVCEYIVEKLGYVELSKEDPKYQEDYQEMRASFLIQYEPELLGSLAHIGDLTEQTEEAINYYISQLKLQQEAAKKVPVEFFDIDLHIYTKENDDNESHIIVEKTRNYIGGGASGNTKMVRRHNREFKKVYRYYGVSDEDIQNKSERFEEVVRMLALPMR